MKETSNMDQQHQFVRSAIDAFISTKKGQKFTFDELRSALGQRGIEVSGVDDGVAGIQFQMKDARISDDSLGGDYKAEALVKRGLSQTPPPAITDAAAQPQKSRSSEEVRRRHMNLLAALAASVVEISAAGWNCLAKLVIALVNTILRALEVVFRLQEGSLARLDKDSGQVIPARLNPGDPQEDEKTIKAMDAIAPALEQMHGKVQSHRYSELLKYFKLLEHGQAPYKFQANGSPSYFARLQIQGGQETVLWGVDIKRAIDEAHAAEGDFIRLQRAGSQSVTVTQQTPDGRIEEINTRRNTWHAEVQPQQDNDQEEDDAREYERERPRG